jgi:hypothetical protein
MDVIAGVFVSVREDDRPLAVRARRSLGEEAHTAVIVGHAPDGLPLVLEVVRRESVEAAVLSALGVIRARLPESLTAALDRLEDEVARRARRLGVVAPSQGNRAPLYVTRARVSGLFGAPLLARALGTQSPLILDEDRGSESSLPERVANTAVCAAAPDVAEVMQKLARPLLLAVPLDEGAPAIVEERDPDRPSELEWTRPLELESLQRFASAAYHFREGHAWRGPCAVEDERGYRQAVRRADAIAWSVERVCVGRAIVELARALETMHAAGRVHADLKPANTLVLARGVVEIDAVDVRAGKASPAATPGWAAPEQILARPVLPATDVYALGLMAAQLVRGAICGEERSYVIPTGGAGRRRVRVLDRPVVFIDPTVMPFSDEARVAWQRVIARAVAFDPDARPRSGAAFAAELDEVLRRHPPPGRLALAGGPGRLTRNVDVLGRLEPSWVVDDSRSS